MTDDFFLFDTERLSGIASDELIKQGFEYFSECRVFALDKSADGLLIAQVEDAEDGENYWVELTRGDNGALLVSCSCHDDQTACCHAVAALFQYADEYGVDDSVLGSAVDEAIQERLKKGRNEVRVKLISGNFAFGIWQASSIVSSTHWQQTYQVHIRSLDQRMNLLYLSRSGR